MRTILIQTVCFWLFINLISSFGGHLQHHDGRTILFIHGFEYRHATQRDIWAARMILFQGAMNPLSISRENNFIVAFDDTKKEEPMIGFGQIRIVDEEYAELASLYVYPEHRRQGIGGKLVETLLSRHSTGMNSNKKVCLLTLEPTTQFYEEHGFRRVTESERRRLPTPVQFEFLAGSVVSSLLGNDIVCMIQKTDQ